MDRISKQSTTTRIAQTASVKVPGEADTLLGAVIEGEEKLVLSAHDFDKFVESLNNPPAPKPALIAARRALRQLREVYPEGNW